MFNCSKISQSNKVQEIVNLVANRTGSNPRMNGSVFIMRCPAHEDKKPSLAIKEGRDGQAMIHCFVGCHYTDICTAIGISPKDLYPKETSQNRMAYKFIKINNKYPKIGAV